MIESRKNIQERIQEALVSRCEIVFAETEGEGRAYIAEGLEQFGVIVVAACLRVREWEAVEPDTLEFVRALRQKFDGPIIAVGTISFLREKLAGENLCTTSCSYDALEDNIVRHF